MPKDLEDIWPCCRLWLEGKATWPDLEETLSVDDVDILNIAVDYWIDIQPKPK